MIAEFNKLELSILNWVKDRYQDDFLSRQIDVTKFQRREWTKVGYFVFLEVPGSPDKLDVEKFGREWPLDGPGLKSSEIEYGGGSIIWGENGYLNCIEMYSYGEYFSEIVQSFELTD